MKNILKLTLLASILTISNAAIAQEDSLSLKYFSRLVPAAWTINIFTLNSKFKDYDYANVLFSSEKIKIKIFKKMSGCAAGLMCPQVMPAPELIVLPVAKTEKRDCWDVYYAKTEDSIKATAYEQIVLQRFASERCHTVQATVDGHLHYRISGTNAAGNAAQADAHFVLKNVKIVEEDSIENSPAAE